MRIWCFARRIGTSCPYLILDAPLYAWVAEIPRTCLSHIRVISCGPTPTDKKGQNDCFIRAPLSALSCSSLSAKPTHLCLDVHIHQRCLPDLTRKGLSPSTAMLKRVHWKSSRHRVQRQPMMRKRPWISLLSILSLVYRLSRRMPLRLPLELCDRRNLKRRSLNGFSGLFGSIPTGESLL